MKNLRFAKKIALTIALSCSLPWTLPAQALPANFVAEVVLGNLNSPISSVFVSETELLILEKDGDIFVTQPFDTTPLATLYLSIPDVDSIGERGLLDITLDPNFELNSHFYVIYSHAPSNRFRISRFTHDTGLIPATILASESVIWTSPDTIIHPFHHGGGLDFGPDGKLYLSIGEQLDAPAAQNVMNVRGTVIRLNKDGTVPTDNPFYDGTGPNADEVWAYGLRNPYRLHWDIPTSGNPRLFIGEVGGNNNSISFEDIHLGSAAANMGWPGCEGNNCSTAYPDFSPPVYTYHHGGSGASVIGGIVYRGSNLEYGYPSSYDGVYFFGDYVDTFIKYLTFDASGTSVTGAIDFMPEGEAGVVVNFMQGPKGSLYYTEIVGPPTFDAGTGRLRRIAYEPNNAPPTITSIMATPSQGNDAPLFVDFSIIVSDPEGQPLSIDWDFGDGFSGNGQNVTHSFSNKGTYQVFALISDGVRNTRSETLTINVGQTPQISITTPVTNSLFSAGEIIPFSVDADDPDGTNDNLEYSWEFNFQHNEHSHPVSGENGSSGSFNVPHNGHSFNSNTGFEFTVKVTDQDGLSSTDTVTVFPDKINLTIVTAPTGLPSISLDGILVLNGQPYDTVKLFEHSLEASDSVCVDAALYTFSHWDHGGGSAQTYTVPATDVTLTATYTETGNCQSALTFNGTGQYVDVPDQSLAEDFTIETWIYLNPGIDNKDAIVGLNGRGQDINFWAGRLRLYDPSTSPVDKIISNTVFQPGIWYHVAISRSVGILSLYVNGIIDATGTWDGIFTPQVIGRGNIQNVGLSGMLDELRLWSVARTSQQVYDNFLEEVSTNSPGLIGYWKFDEPAQEQNVTDSSNAGNAGSLGDSLFVEGTDPTRITSSAPLNSNTGGPANISPTAADDNVSLLQGASVEINVASNDQDSDGQLNSASIVIVNQPTFGAVSLDGTTGVLTYTHSGATALSDSFSYTISDIEGATSNSAIVSIDVLPSLMSCNRAMLFDGQNDWINIPDQIIAGDFTFETWVYFNAGLSNADAMIGLAGSGQDLNFYAGRARFYAPGDVLISPTTLNSEKWYHLALVRSSGELTLYIDGIPDASSTWDGVFTPQALANGNLGPKFSGQMDEVRLWNVARTASEIASTYWDTATGIELGLIGYWKFNEGELDETALDNSLASNHGSLGSTLFSGGDEPRRVVSTAPFTASCSGSTAPFALPDEASLSTGESINIPVLSNDSDPDGNIDPESVNIIDFPALGDVSVNPLGEVTYAHFGSVGTQDSFSYTVSDLEAQTSNVASVAIEIVENVCAQALLFGGLNDRVNIPDYNFTGDFTFETWVNLAPGINNKDAMVGLNGRGQDINFWASRMRLYDPTTSPVDKIISTTTFFADTWYHVALTRSANTLSLYVNGVLDATGTWNGAFTPQVIGRGNIQGAGLSGMLDELRLWDVSRTAAQVLADHNQIISAASLGLVGYWQFEESLGSQIVTDSSASGNNATLGADIMIGPDDPLHRPSTAPIDDQCP